MVAFIFSCPHCHAQEPIVRFGYNASGSERLWCKDCRRAFTPNSRDDRRITAEKQERIVQAATERLSQRAAARLLKVGRDTIRETLKKSAPPLT